MEIENKTLNILRLCLKLDELALSLYSTFSENAGDGDLRKFWKSLAKDEAMHVGFWKKAIKVNEGVNFPEVFSDTDVTEKSLREALIKGERLLDKFSEFSNVKDCFAATYRLEFYFLHPMLAELFYLLGTSAGAPHMLKAYDEHVERYLGGLEKFGEVTPEMELLGETIRNLWSRNKALSREATTDPLTGLMNRRSFFVVATQLAHLARRNGSTLAVMMADIDDFKQVNDTMGHGAGDKVIQFVADVISDSVRTSDFVARYGGEEFIVLLPETDSDATRDIAERIRKNVEKTSTGRVNVTVSIGVCDTTVKNDPAAELDGVIAASDAALYRAKQTGKNRVVLGKRGRDD